MIRRLPVVALLPIALAALVPSACSRQSPSPAQPAARAPEAGPASTVPRAGSNPAVETVTGEVVETIDASNYTYLRVRTPGGELWAATGRTAVAAGETVTVPLETEMRNFHSPSLNRDFPVIYFVSRVGRGGSSAAAAPVAGHGGGMGSAAEDMKVDPVPPPTGGSSIADLWAGRASLAGRTATVRGRVVKFNAGILGRNWLHLQDGSGRAADGTHDLTVTTDAAVKVGDVVTVTGTVALDKDIGAGYVYKLLLEGAKIR